MPLKAEDHRHSYKRPIGGDVRINDMKVFRTFQCTFPGCGQTNRKTVTSPRTGKGKGQKR